MDQCLFTSRFVEVTISFYILQCYIEFEEGRVEQLLTEYETCGLSMIEQGIIFNLFNSKSRCDEYLMTVQIYYLYGLATRTSSGMQYR
jgi:hypothetical protein